MDNKGGIRQRSLVIILLVILVIFSLFFLTINFITDWIWFKEMGYVAVFFKKLFTELKVGIPVFIILAVILNFYLKRLRKKYFSKITSDESTDMKKLNRYTDIISVIFAALMAFYAVTHLWFQILKFANSTDFGTKDPLFNLDISFYIFKLDFLKELDAITIGLVVLIIVVTVLYYLILLTMHSPRVFEEKENAYEENPYNRGGGGNPFAKIFGASYMGTGTPKQFSSENLKEIFSIASGSLSFLGVMFFLLLAVHFFLKQFDLLSSHTGVVYGAGYTDINITLWLYRILIVLALVGAVIVVHQIHKKQFKRILTIPVIMIAVGALGSGVGLLVQNYVVSPNEISKEEQYLERNIQFTQKAYHLDHVSSRSFAADNKLTSEDITNNSETIGNIRINDYVPVNAFYNQTQSIRKYYQFNNVDIDRYMINGKYTQSYLATREIDEAKLKDTWLNKHLKFTHGYGITLSRVDKVTASGQPDVIIKNIPPMSEAREITIDRPEVYFGELSNDYIIVKTSEDEFDYPDGETNKYTKYDGTAGIRLTPLNRILFSLREQSLKLLVSSNINSNSRIIINRNVLERVKKIMPQLGYEDDPYAVVADGRIYWMIDAYTTSSNYPYSEPYLGRLGTPNYIRNSVKVVVDAYNGDVKFYIVDEEDPIAKTFQKIYPSLLRPFDDMPEGLKPHIRYPNTLFEIQAAVYSRYHMEDVKVFYLDEDAWDISDEIYGTEQERMRSNYYILKLPGEEKAEFVNSIPFTPKSKQNMTALMIARNDGEHYGEIVLYRFPKSKTIYGPMQIEAQIDQKPEISSDFTLWSSSGSKYSRGNLFVIPIETSLIYVEPVYLEAANSAIPEVKRVIVAYSDKISFEATLGEALDSLFGEGASSTIGPEPPIEPEEPTSREELIKKASEAFTKGQDALKEGNWAEYGVQMKVVQDCLNKLL